MAEVQIIVRVLPFLANRKQLAIKGVHVMPLAFQRFAEKAVVMHFRLLFILFAFCASATGQVASASDHDRLGQAAFAAGQYREAKEHFERALRVTVESRLEERAAILANLGQACQAIGELAHAEQLYREALIDLPASPLIRNLLGGVLAQQRRFEEAEQQLRRAIAAAPGGKIGAAARSDLAAVLEASGKRREAVELLEQAIAMSPPGRARARMLCNFGEFLLRSGRWESAVAALLQSLEDMDAAVGSTHPDTAQVLRVYSEALAKAGKKQEAKKASTRADKIRLYTASQTNSNHATVDYRDLRK